MRGLGLRLSGATASPLVEVLLRYMCRRGTGHEPTRIAQYAAICRYRLIDILLVLLLHLPHKFQLGHRHAQLGFADGRSNHGPIGAVLCFRYRLWWP